MENSLRRLMFSKSNLCIFSVYVLWKIRKDTKESSISLNKQTRNIIKIRANYTPITAFSRSKRSFNHRGELCGAYEFNRRSLTTLLAISNAPLFESGSSIINCIDMSKQHRPLYSKKYGLIQTKRNFKSKAITIIIYMQVSNKDGFHQYTTYTHKKLLCSFCFLYSNIYF